MNKFHKVENVQIEKGVLSLIVDGSSIQRRLDELSLVLANATEGEQKQFEVSPSGYGIHWAHIDEDISIDGLLGIVHRPSENKKRHSRENIAYTFGCYCSAGLRR